MPRRITIVIRDDCGIRCYTCSSLAELRRMLPELRLIDLRRLGGLVGAQTGTDERG